MCTFGGGGGGRDNSADEARQREEQRQGRIKEGRGKIDEAFTQFDDPYYSGVEKAYLDYYNPELDKQYNDARRKVVLSLAGKGNLASGAGARTLGELTTQYEKNRSMLANQAIDARNQARSDVESARSELYDQNISAADPAAIAVQAASRAGSIATPRAYSPLADLFSGLINSAALTVAADNTLGQGRLRSALFSPTTGSSRVVN
jgi:hypothetical protein